MDKDQRIQQLLEANNTYVENNRKLKLALREARDKFSYYAEEHWRKTHDPQLSSEAKHSASVKARANEAMVSKINSVLKETAPK